jgi:hypothetical protein
VERIRRGVSPDGDARDQIPILQLNPRNPRRLQARRLHYAFGVVGKDRAVNHHTSPAFWKAFDRLRRTFRCSLAATTSI